MSLLWPAVRKAAGVTELAAFESVRLELGPGPTASDLWELLTWVSSFNFLSVSFLLFEMGSIIPTFQECCGKRQRLLKFLDRKAIVVVVVVKVSGSLQSRGSLLGGPIPKVTMATPSRAARWRQLASFPQSGWKRGVLLLGPSGEVSDVASSTPCPQLPAWGDSDGFNDQTF